MNIVAPTVISLGWFVGQILSPVLLGIEADYKQAFGVAVASFLTSLMIWASK